MHRFRGCALSSARSPTSDEGTAWAWAGRYTPARKVRVIVDMREFRSSLPSLLHLHGLDVIPVTLEAPPPSARTRAPARHSEHARTHIGARTSVSTRVCVPAHTRALACADVRRHADAQAWHSLTYPHTDAHLRTHLHTSTLCIHDTLARIRRGARTHALERSGACALERSGACARAQIPLQL